MAGVNVARIEKLEIQLNSLRKRYNNGLVPYIEYKRDVESILKEIARLNKGRG